MYPNIKSVRFNDLKKESNSQRLKDKPFWIWNIEKQRQEDIIANGDCSFNRMIGLPIKDGLKKPIFDYQHVLYDTLIPSINNPLKHDFKHKHLWSKRIGDMEYELQSSLIMGETKNQINKSHKQSLEEIKKDQGHLDRYNTK